MRDSKTKHIDKGKLLFRIGIPVILLLIIIRFVLYYVKSSGFSGISVLLPVLLCGFMVFALAASGLFAAWVYQDCRIRGDDAVLWAAVVLIATPFIGLLIYFLRRLEIKQTCKSCGHRISLSANYCEECGIRIENKEDIIMEKQNTHHLGYIAAGVVALVFMFICLTGFVVSAATKGNVNTDVTSDEKVWNLGAISMKHDSYIKGVWKLDFKHASDGFVAEEKMKIKDADESLLYADITCGVVPEDASLTLWLVQGDMKKSIDVTNLSEPLEYTLDEFENGTVYVRLLIEGVEECVSEIYIK